MNTNDISAIIFEYAVNGKPGTKIADEYSYSTNEIYEKLKHFGIDTRKRKGGWAKGRDCGEFANTSYDDIRDYVNACKSGYDEGLRSFIDETPIYKPQKPKRQTVSSYNQQRNDRGIDEPRRYSSHGGTSSSVNFAPLIIILFAVILLFNFVIKPIYVGAKNAMENASYSVAEKTQKDVELNKITYKDGEYIGITKSKKPSSFGKLITEEGELQLGKFKRGKLSGEGYRQISYFEGELGKFKSGKLDGFGIKQGNSEVYIGYFDKGEKEGIGITVSATKTIDIGEYKNDEKIEDIGTIDGIFFEVELYDDENYSEFVANDGMGIVENTFLKKGISVKTDGQYLAVGHHRFGKPSGDVVVLEKDTMLVGEMDGENLENSVLMTLSDNYELGQLTSWENQLEKVEVGDLIDGYFEGLMFRYDVINDGVYCGYMKDGNVYGNFSSYLKNGTQTNAKYRNGEVVE